MRLTCPALLGLLALASSLAAQSPSSRADTGGIHLPRWSAGVGVAVAQPVGDFHRAVDNAVGGAGHLLLRVDHTGRVALRLEGGWLNYGDESHRICLASTPGCRVAVNVTTANGILTLGVGPQLSFPISRLKAYGYSVVGMSRFSTVTTIGGGIVPDFVAGDENFGDGGVWWNGGLGVQLPLHGRTTLDVGVSVQGHGRRNYLLEGGVTDNADGSLLFDIKRSNANLFALKIGATTPLKWGRRHSPDCTCPR